MQILLILLALLTSSPRVLYPQTTVPPGDPLVGLWGTGQSFGPLVRGTLTIDSRQARWRATIAGFEVSVERNADRLKFSLPGGAGATEADVRNSYPY